ncbi:diaminopropionate ammonia-lyase [Natranaerovirga hydrolytica]|uniref:Diaminopropionate ammonia-lyase n=1 Tax=Natranaerovirga hydrolytica TaxID=680378 RepID=A0A4R1MWX4_9FIRM|nr:diaminopropionate ammonia-lyase [Natranaerovirga hydrolytica]TCK97748.1 diaminopropionate ammonia-lyase [Natranaerovirga hydrolytica]
MNKEIKWTKNNMKLKDQEVGNTPLIDEKTSEEVKNFHSSFEEYQVTPLRHLGYFSESVGIKKVLVKDESYRFGLNAFKVLGAAYAMGKTLAQRLGKSIDELPFSVLKSPEVKKELGEVAFLSTTDGNHGRGVAWTANQLGQKASIFMPKGTTQNRLNHILKLGANAEITDYNYDDTVRWMVEEGKKTNAEIIQDTAWEGYEDVPRWIMQGYSTVAKETIEQLGDKQPTHIFLQAGVGAFAAIMTSIFINHYKDNPPKIIILEANQADCFYQSIQEEKVIPVTGDLNTIMAGLACGEPNPLAWEILSTNADVFVSVPDWVSAKGMRILGNPLSTDPKVISGESGAVGVGLLSVLNLDENKALKEALEIDEDSIVLNFSTEGDTDANTYREIVWDGKYPME